MILTGKKPKYWEKIQSQCHSVHHKSHKDWSGFVSCIVRSQQLPKQWHGVPMHLNSLLIINTLGVTLCEDSLNWLRIVSIGMLLH